MPKKPKFTREMLLQEAYNIARDQGIEEVSARSLSKRLGCSIQPVYTHFPSMAVLRQETFRYACRQFTREIFACRSDMDPFRWATICTVDLARNQPNLFKLIFMMSGFATRTLPETIAEMLKNQKLSARIMEIYDLDRESCESVMIRGELFLLGICSMICSFRMEISDEQIDRIMTQTISDLVEGVKVNPPEMRFPDAIQSASLSHRDNAAAVQQSC